MRKQIALIFAIAQNGVIGNHDVEKPMSWFLPEDLTYFQKTTIGEGNNMVVAGSKTWFTIKQKYRPLKKRKNIILSRTIKSVPEEGVVVLSSIEELIDYIDKAEGIDKVFIAGGLEIYRQLMPYAQEIYVTRVHGSPEGDVIWDDLKLGIDTGWMLDTFTEYKADEENAYDMVFEKWVRN